MLCPAVWWGAGIGIIGSIIAGGVFAAVYYVASTSLFSGNGKLIFQGCISWVACILITYLGFAMLRFSNIEQKYMRKLDGAARTVSVMCGVLGEGVDRGNQHYVAVVGQLEAVTASQHLKGSHTTVGFVRQRSVV